jgi:nucleotide-binding universal stress UspA family protein
MLRLTKILVPIDFSDTSLAALRESIELARSFGASLVVMHAYELPVMGLGVVPEATYVLASADADRIAAVAAAALVAVAREYADCGVPIEWLLREGPPWREIDVVAEHTGADLIVLGTRARRGFLHALFGGVADRVVRSTHTPVLTLHAVEAT